MQKEQIAVHTVPSKTEEQLLQTTPTSNMAPAPPAPTTALVPVSHQQTPPIVESTIVIEPPRQTWQEPLPEDEAEPVSDIPVDIAVPRRQRRSLLLFTFVLILLISTGLYFLLPVLFPTAIVTIVPVQKKLTTTATIHIAATTTQPAANQIPGRLLPSLTLSQAETVKTTGIGHQAATYAQGYITFYNGLLASQTIAAGTLLTGADGIQVMTDQTAVIPAGNPPIYGQVTISVHAIMPGSRGNIAGYDINTAISSSILAKNIQPFYGGRDARTYPMVTQSDIDTAVTHLKPSLSQSIQGAFSSQLQTGEALITPHCVLKTVPNHQVGEEATEVQVQVSETCQTAAYQQSDLQQVVSHVVSQEVVTRFGPGYGLVGDMSITLASTTLTTSSQEIAALQVNAISKWVYQVGTAERQKISKQLAGKSEQQALHLLSHLNGIRTVTVHLTGGYNDTLPQDSARIQVVVIYQFV